MSASDVDAYLANVPEPQRSTLGSLRETLRGLLPEAEEAIAYGAPSFRLDGTAVAGYASYAQHCSYLPMSGTVLTTLAKEVAGYSTSKGALKFPVDRPLPKALVAKLVRARLAEIAGSRPKRGRSVPES